MRLVADHPRHVRIGAVVNVGLTVAICAYIAYLAWDAWLNRNSPR